MEYKHTVNFWNTLASGNYREGLVGHYNAHMEDPNEEKYLFRNIPLDGSLLALEFGCGPGRNMIKFKDKFSRIDGADISSVILEKALIDLAEANVSVPNLYHTNGYSLDMINDNIYDVVFSIICMQHIGSRDWRLSLYKHFHRILKNDGTLTFQTGFGPGHPISVDYYHNYTEEDEKNGKHFDVRTEHPSQVIDDLTASGFTNITYEITNPCRDQHPLWIWFQAKKEQ